MDVTPLVPNDRSLIRGYGDGGFTIKGVRYEGSVLVFPGHVLPWPVASFAQLTLESLAPVLANRPMPEFLLLGSGTEHLFPDPAIRNALRAAGLVVECMATGPASRTWNVLLTEGREAAAALIAV